MLAPDIALEEKRLRTLRDLRVLDTPPDPFLDDIVRTVAELSDAPVGLVSLIDRDRLWVKSRWGTEMSEVPRSISFCNTTIASDRPLVVPNAAEDSRFAEMPHVTAEPGIRSYAGAPLVTANGQRIGALCVMDYRSREFSPALIDALSRFSRRVVGRFEENQTLQTLREQLANEARLGSIGRLASSFAHEISTPVATLLWHLARMKAAQTRGNLELREVGEALPKLEAAGTRIAKITDFLKQRLRGTSQDPAVSYRAKQLVDETLLFSQARAKLRGVALSVGKISPFAHLHCRPVEVSQALLNLVMNAIDAAAEAPVRWVRLDLKNVGNWAELWVTDSGPGIPPEVADRLFESPITTKETGTGIGLTIAHELARSNGGDLFQDKTCEQTRFVLRVPRPPAI